MEGVGGVKLTILTKYHWVKEEVTFLKVTVFITWGNWSCGKM